MNTANATTTLRMAQVVVLLAICDKSHAERGALDAQIAKRKTLTNMTRNLLNVSF